jgi:imidazolonepropionase-like amidohydrolase
VGALRAATSVGAACLGLDETGVLREGAIADVTVVGGAPDSRPEALAPPFVEHVFRAGRWVK